MNDKPRTPLFGYDYKSSVTFVASLYPEGNVQVYWCRDPDDGTGTWTGQQFQSLSPLIGMWGTLEIHVGLPFRLPFVFQRKLERLKVTTFAEYYRQNMTTWVLSKKEREALGITDKDYDTANIARWGDNWKRKKD